jgi:hypothetical protein
LTLKRGPRECTNKRGSLSESPPKLKKSILPDKKILPPIGSIKSPKKSVVIHEENGKVVYNEFKEEGETKE